jgi:signal transduction histidine kinase
MKLVFSLLLYFLFAGCYGQSMPDLNEALKTGNMTAVNSPGLAAFAKTIIKRPQSLAGHRITAHRLLCKLYDHNQSGLNNGDSLLHYGRMLIAVAGEAKDFSAEAEGRVWEVVAVSYVLDAFQVLETGLSSLEVLGRRSLDNKEVYQSEIMVKLAYAYQRMEDHVNADRFARKAISILRQRKYPVKEPALLAKAYLTSARIHGYFRNIPKAITRLDSALFFNNLSGDTMQSFYIRNDRASLLLDSGQPAAAIPILEVCISYFRKTKDQYGISESSMLLGKAYLLKKNYPESTSYALGAVSFPSNSRIRIGAYETLYRIYKETGQDKLALAAYEQVINLREGIFNAKLSGEKQRLESKMALQRQELLVGVEKQRVETQKTFGKIAVGGAVLMFLIAVFLFFNRSLIIRKNLMISSQKRKIEALNTGLEAKVAERTSELQQAYDKIKDAVARGQGQERKRVAAELHDTLGSLLSSVGFGLDAMQQMPMPERERKIFDRLVGMVDHAYDEVRLLSHNYYPKELEEEGLVGALGKFTEKLNLYSKTRFYFQAGEHIRPLPRETEQHLYAICLELCNNIEKHAFATRASIIYQHEGNFLKLSVHDNGRGIDDDMDVAEGMGMKNIRERLRAIGGTLSTELSSPGTTFSILIPLLQLNQTEQDLAGSQI